jgi:glycosyltransferase involved in cell wall biosynthesis
MRIGLVSTLIQPLCEPFVGGAEVLTAQLAEALARRGHEVSVLCLPGSQLEGVRLVHPATEGKSILWPAALPDMTAQTYDVLVARELAWFAEGLLRLAKDVDVLHNNSHDTLALFAAATLQTPMLTTLHMAPFLPGLAQMLAALWRVGQPIPVVTVSEEISRLYKSQLGVDAPVVENGVDVERLPCHPTEQRQGALFVGRMVEGKGPHHAIAIARRAGLPLTLIGPIQEQAYFDAKVRPELSSDITLAGHLPRAQVLERMARAQVMLVTPSLEEAGSIAGSDGVRNAGGGLRARLAANPGRRRGRPGGATG